VGPEEESLTSWFAGVERPPGNDPAERARWLREYLDYLMSNPRWRERSVILDLDCEADETVLERLINVTPDLHRTLRNAGFGVVACHVLTPRHHDLSLVTALAYAGFQPEATMLLLNEGRVDPSSSVKDAFSRVRRDEDFRDAVARGAVVARLPALDGDVMREIEGRRLDFGMAHDGPLVGGSRFQPLDSLARGTVGDWLERMEEAFERIRTWLP
jgi:hypothetical protein